MDTGLRTDVLTHCATCSSCARSLREQRALTEACRLLAQDPQALVETQSVPDSLTMALRARAVGAQPIVRRYRWAYWGAAAAAALLLFFAIGAARLQQQGEIPQQTLSGEKAAVINQGPTRPVQTASPLPTPEKEKPQRRRQNKPDSEPQLIRPGDREAIASNSAKNSSTAPDYNHEIATEFLPLGYGNALNLQDGGQIVRVEVPRSTLVSFGLPVNLNRSSERVKAELLVGVDGSARAIRFIQ
jgi:hypothetical protein